MFPPTLPGTNSKAASYAARVAAERAIYEDNLDIHDLPAIHHYWANQHLRPRLETFGFSSPGDLFYQTLRRQLLSGGPSKRFLSVGSGNCDLEIGLGARLGEFDFTIECLDLNPAMLARGRAGARNAGVGEHLEFFTADLNSWEPARSYDAVIANQTLHHVLNLEGLFAGIRQALKPGAPFAISDMIGRNGHLRWPEARAIVNEFWRDLPPSYRFNSALQRFERQFQDWDCSTESFEGVRSQDVLPLLNGVFQFEFFFGFANIIDPFIDRQFGFNFDPRETWVRHFIDEVHARDEAEQLAGTITPTHLLAIVTGDVSAQPPICYPISSREAVRRPESVPVEFIPVEDGSPYVVADWSRASKEVFQTEIAFFDRTIFAAQQKTAQVEREMIDRTSWALRLDADIESQRERLAELEMELEGRTAWARSLERDCIERTEWAHRLEDQLLAERRVASQLVFLRPGLRNVYQALRSAWHQVRAFGEKLSLAK